MRWRPSHWAVSVSKGNFVKLPSFNRILILIKHYVRRRDAFLRRIGFNEERTKKGIFLLEFAREKIDPQDTKSLKEYDRLIFFREKLVGLLWPYYKQIARLRILKKLGPAHLGLVEDAEIEKAIMNGSIRGLDKTQPDKIGVRKDFVIAYVDRVIEKKLRRKVEKERPLFTERKRFLEEHGFSEERFMIAEPLI